MRLRACFHLGSALLRYLIEQRQASADGPSVVYRVGENALDEIQTDELKGFIDQVHSPGVPDMPFLDACGRAAAKCCTAVSALVHHGRTCGW